MSKSLFVGFLVGVLAFTIVSVGAQQDQKTSEKQYQSEISDATPVQIGTLTQRQQVHSRLFKGIGQRIGGKTLSEWITAYRGQRVIVETNLLGRTFLTSEQPQTPEEYFSKLAQESNAIIRGKVIRKASQITEDDSFLFTDYDVLVLEVLRNAHTISPGATITVTSLGGKIVVDEVILKAGGNGDITFKINQEVLLFLNSIPETGAYKLTRSNAAFELNGTSVRPLTGLLPLSSDVFKDESSFLNTVKALLK